MQRSTKAQAQAQAQRQEAIQPAQSIALCQALLRVSIYHVRPGALQGWQIEQRRRQGAAAAVWLAAVV